MRPRDRRALVLGVVLIGSAWLALRGIPRLAAAWQGQTDRLAAEERLLRETRDAIASLPHMEDSARNLTARVASLAPRILSGASAPVALSDLSGRFGTLAGLTHGCMTRFEALPDSVAAGPLRKVTATVGIETDFKGIAELLERLARDTLVTVVERVQLTPSDPQAPPATPERLDVELRVSAWYLRRGRDS
jgi:Type II secretion system (T2SS), protein M subtype b